MSIRQPPTFYSIHKMKYFLTIIILSALFLSSCSKNAEPGITPEAEGKATVVFDAIMGSSDFALEKDFTVNGSIWNFTQLRYWVSNIVLIKDNGDEFPVPNSYYLIEENKSAETNSTHIYPENKRENVELIGIPAGEYKAIRFSIGVPERYNNNLSLQAGELSQLNGMTNVSWMWATSYIFTSLKGRVTDAGTSRAIKIETGLNVNYKTLSLTLPNTVRISSSKPTSIVLNADVSKITDGLDVMVASSVGASQPAAMSSVSANFAGKVFTVKSVK